ALCTDKHARVHRRLRPQGLRLLRRSLAIAHPKRTFARCLRAGQSREADAALRFFLKGSALGFPDSRARSQPAGVSPSQADKLSFRRLRSGQTFRNDATRIEFGFGCASTSVL